MIDRPQTLTRRPAGEALIRGKHILLKAIDEYTVDTLDDGAVFQRNGRIEAIGRFEELAARYPNVDVVGGAGDLVIPGLVNSHHHIGLTPVQLGSPDLPLELWLTHQIRHKVVPPYLDTLYSAFELIASGVTAVQHLGGMKPAPVTDWPSNGSAIVNAYLDIGMRVSFAFCNRDQHRLVYGPDDDFVASLPDGLRERASAFLTRSHFELEDYETLYLRPMLETYGKHPLVRIWLAPINLERASDRLLTLTRDWAERHGIGIHLHLSETPYQKEFSQRRFGKSSLAHLEDIGILGPHLTVGHGTWICESDLDIVARHGVCVCHNASSNLRLRSGIAPVLEFLKRGIPVAMGIDEAGLNDDRDMLQEMRLIKHIHAKPGLYEKTVTPAEIFKMATEHGARATGFGDVIGTIEVGKRADLVVLDYARITEPYFEPGRAPVDALVYRAKAEHVKLTMIDGNVVYRDGKFAFVDRAETFAKIKADLERPRTETEELRASFSNDIFPHVKDFYLDWTLPEANPWYVLNGR